jgi:shikimate dehydrogenase
MTDKYAVIGNPITHSKSPVIHKMFAEQTGQDISYEAILAPLDGFAATVERLRIDGYKGCNVTVPFKFEALQLSTWLNARAQSAHAVNTLKFEDGAIKGFNTDGIGLERDIKNNLGFEIAGKHVLLMGAGGAEHGVAQPLFDINENLAIVNRSVEKARRMTDSFDKQHKAVVNSYEEIAGQQFDLIVNATSSGLSDELPPLPPSIFATGALAYDMMYGRETPYMRFAREHGAAVVSDGLGMLVEQAAESFFIWRGVRPETAPVIAALRAER